MILTYRGYRRPRPARARRYWVFGIVI
eukprot:COSAG02_NODE_51581_length_313_cov_0.728972_1_plen_27_part_01